MSDEAGLALRWLTVLLVGFVLQIGVLADVQPFGVHADLMLLMGICAGLAGGPTRGAVIGFAAGLLVDAVMPGTLGISALSYSVVGFTVGSFRESVMSSTRSMDMLVAAAGSAAGVLLFALLSQLLGQHSSSDPRLLQIVGIVAVLNAVLCVPVLAVGRWAEGDTTHAGIR
ncbi:MAG: rod shape-determining protein MreD [Microthrixaceae bacterium]